MKRRILLIDDDEAILDVFTILLTARNYACDCARDVLAANALIQQNEYAAVIADFSQQDGRSEEMQLLESLLRLPSNPKVIVCSGHATSEAQNQVLLMGADMFVAKPFTFKSLLRNMEALLNSHRPNSVPVASEKLLGMMEAADAC